jgi:outer membrane protein assembly factor BamA
MRPLAIASIFIGFAINVEAQQPPTSRPTGHSITGLPAVNFDADEGFGYGALLQYYEYGSGKADPYKYMLQPTIFFTTRGRRDLTLFLDAPHWLPDEWRMGFQFASELQRATPYYGIGNNTVSLDIPDNSPNPFFYRFERNVLRANVDLQHPLFVPGLRGLVGIGSRTAHVNTVPYDSGTTLLELQTLRRKLPVTETRYARLGLVYDTRDKEISTHTGNWSDFLVQRAGDVLGGNQVFTRITGTVRQYLPLGPKLTLAERVVLQTVHGDPAVSEIFTLQNSYRDDEFLGGATSIRGLPKNRYVGKGVAFANSELRWSATQFEFRLHPVQVVLSGFVDAGRVWTKGLDISEAFSDLHVGYGGGVHFEIGPTSVVSADVGHSSQSTAAVYIGLGYLF